ncbi:MAG: ABC transporter ATP-binding protein [Cyclobacteriaceae bacterium]
MNTYLRILSYARPLKKTLPFYVVFTILSAVFNTINLALLAPILKILFQEEIPETTPVKPEYKLNIDYFAELFDFYFVSLLQQEGKLNTLYYVLGFFLSITLLYVIFLYLSSIILSHIRANVITNIRTSIYENVTSLDLGFFTNERKGDVMSRITNDVQQIEATVVNSMKVIFREPVYIIAYMIAMLSFSVNLTIFALLYILMTGFIISEIIKKLKKQSHEIQETMGRIVSMLDESLSGIRVIKAFNAVKLINLRFKKEVDQYARTNISMAYKNEMATPVSQLLGALAIAGLVIYGAGRVFQGFIEASFFLTFIVIFTQLLNPSKAISKEVSSIQRGIAAGERIFSIIDLKPRIINIKEAEEIREFKDNIEFKNVSFAYKNERVLKNINLTIKKGTTLALVGMSGGGKSTLADLVPRFYDPVEGAIYLDGKPLKNYEIESLRQLMGIVTQESILFNDSIYNNIAFGKPDANLEEVERAAKIANAHQFIVQTENGYKTNIGERGTKLSGGQRQRISIARAVLRNPPILILDEATSALDSESEKLVQEALINLMKNRSSIVIAHRLSTIQHADEIVVLQDGEIVERGKHEQLVKNNMIYTKLTAMQSV